MFKAKRIADDDLQPKIESVTVELDDRLQLRFAAVHEFVSTTANDVCKDSG